MTRESLELWFDFSCPYAYLASRRAPHIARAAGVDLVWKPFLLGGVFRGIGAGDGPMATLGPAKAAHNYRDMHRWAEVFGAPFKLPPAHPMRTVRALRTLLSVPHSRWPEAIEQLYAAYWQRNEDITSPTVIGKALSLAGVSDADIAAAAGRTEDPEVKEDLRKRTDEAMGLGIFGAPAWVVRRASRKILVWGQDRMPWVDAVLAGWDPDESDPPAGARPFGEGTQGFTSRSTLDVYFDVSSPFAYLGLTQLPALAKLTGVTPRLVPILLGGLFRDIGQVDVPLAAMPPPKMDYFRKEMFRWARWWGVPFAEPSKFPQRTIMAQRLCVIAARQDNETGVRVAQLLARAMWAEREDIEDEPTLKNLLFKAGLPPDWVDQTKQPDVKAELIANTTKAKDAGVFGVPTWVVDEKYLFWGQDRIELAMRALGGWKPEHG